MDQEVWPRLTELAAKAKRAYVAVAYVGSDAHQLLKLKRGSVLVADCSVEAARAGQVNPDAIAAYLDGGVRVYRHPGLHAKVYVFDDTAVIGSANISKRSRDQLVEAAVATSTKGDVAAARAFVASLAQEPVTADLLAEMKAAWQQPKFKPATKRPRLKWHPIPDHDAWTLWCIYTEDTDLPGYIQAAVDAHHGQVKRLATAANFRLETLLWETRPPFRADDVLIERWIDDQRRPRANPPARVERIWSLERAGKKRTLVTLQRSTTMATKSGRTLRQAAEAVGLRLNDSAATQKVSKEAHQDALLAVWGVRATGSP